MDYLWISGLLNYIFFSMDYLWVLWQLILWIYRSSMDFSIGIMVDLWISYGNFRKKTKKAILWHVHGNGYSGSMAMDIVDLWQLILWIYRRSIVDR